MILLALSFVWTTDGIMDALYLLHYFTNFSLIYTYHFNFILTVIYYFRFTLFSFCVTCGAYVTREKRNPELITHSNQVIFDPFWVQFQN